MDNRINQILGASKSKLSVNTDTYTNIQFENNKKLLPPDEINKVVDLNNQFNIERQSSTSYRILGKINPLISNPLFNTTIQNNPLGSNDCWEQFSTALFTDNPISETNPNLTFAQSIKKHLKEVEGWYGYFEPRLTLSKLCNFYDMEPKRERFSFLEDTTNVHDKSIKNWELTITYPYSADTTHTMISNGLLIIDTFPVIVGGKPMTAFAVPVFHNLTNGGVIRLTGTSIDGDYDVKRVGLDDGNLQDNVFCIDVEYSKVQIHIDSRMTKLYNDVPSQYYFRKFKKIKTKSSDVIETDDYEIYKLAFSENIYTDDIFQFIFNEDIDVSNLVDNLGRPLSELYLSVVKTDSNGIFTNITSGIEAPIMDIFNSGNTLTYLKDVPVIQKIHGVVNYTSETFKALETNVMIGNDDFYGDVIEYNVTTLQEIVLSDIFHRFNTVNRETTNDKTVGSPRPEGYYYKAHNLIRIRDFSSYIEQGDNNTIGMPDYKENLGDGRYLWRDMLEIGVIDINKTQLNYPFVNGCHYMFNNYIFELKRQDPFDNWMLFFSTFPADPIGNILEKQFNVNFGNNVC